MSKEKLSNQNSAGNSSGSGANPSGGTVEVLYQRMGDRWYAFSLIDDEVFYGTLTKEELESHSSSKSQAPSFKRRIGNA